MTQTSSVRVNHLRRRRGSAFGLGAAAGALVAMALSQLADAPCAHADDWTDIVDHVQMAMSIGQDEISAAGTSLLQNDFGDAMIQAVVGWDNFSLASQQDLFVQSIEALAGSPLTDYGFGLFPMDVDLSTAVADAQGLLSDGQDEFNLALSNFGGGDFILGLAEAVTAYDAFIAAPQEVFVGWVDTLLGF